MNFGLAIAGLIVLARSKFAGQVDRLKKVSQSDSLIEEDEKEEYDAESLTTLTG